MAGKVVLLLDFEDAAIVGATLRILGRTNRCPDPSVGERLVRVGTALQTAAMTEVLPDAAVIEVPS